MDRANFNFLEMDDEERYCTEDGPFTGEAFLLHPDESVAWTRQFKNGYADGPSREFHPNGNLAAEGEWSYGARSAYTASGTRMAPSRRRRTTPAECPRSNASTRMARRRTVARGKAEHAPDDRKLHPRPAMTTVSALRLRFDAVAGELDSLRPDLEVRSRLS